MKSTLITGLKPYNYESITISSTALGLTEAKYTDAVEVLITVEDDAIRCRFDGLADPTATEGHKLIVTSSLTLRGKDMIANFSAIRVTADAILRITYFK